MNKFIARREGRLCVENVDVAGLAGQTGTPFYCYSRAAMEEACRNFAAAVDHPKVKIHYAVKANSNLAVIRLLSNRGCGMDVVSGGELARCRKAGVKAGDILFSGAGKSAEEIEAALLAGIGQFNVESLPELDAVSRAAQRLGRTAPVALRMNPEVEAGHHAKASTGKEEDKFGINWDQVEKAYAVAEALPGLELKGLSMHIGSQIVSAAPYVRAAARMEDMIARLRKAGHRVEHASLGGGLGISYRGENIELEEYGKLARGFAERTGCAVKLEPGRFLVGEAGILVTKVLYIKHGTVKDFMIVDAAMNDLIRPTLYDSWHAIEPVIWNPSGPSDVYDVVGPVCETGDYFALDRQLPVCQAHDLVAILCAGAYGACMASTYNSRALIPEILVSGKNFALIRPRLTIEQQMAWETVPDWLERPVAKD